MRFSRDGLLDAETFTHQLVGQTLEVEITYRSGPLYHLLNERPCSRRFTPCEIALNEPQGGGGPKIGKLRALEPGGEITKFGDSGVHLPAFDQSIAADRPCRCGMIGDRLKRERLVAIPESSLDVALLNMGERRAPQSGGLEQRVVEGCAIVERSAASIEAFLPVA